MAPEQMAKAALSAVQNGTRMTLVRIRGKKPPKGFPRGELLCENSDGRNVYSYDPHRVIAWLNANRLIAIEVLPPNSDIGGKTNDRYRLWQLQALEAPGRL